MKTLSQTTIISLFSVLCINLSYAMYDPQPGRFMQREQLGINPVGGKQNPFMPAMEYKDGMNLYQYCQSDPVNYTDYWGLRRYEIACTPIAEGGEWWREWLRKLGMPHCELHAAGLSAPGDDVYPVFRKTRGVLLAGPAIGKDCKCAKRNDIDMCVKAVRKKVPWGSAYPNCHTQTSTILYHCCLKSRWVPPLVAGPIVYLNSIY